MEKLRDCPTLWVDYEEYLPWTYKGIKMTFSYKEALLFNSGFYELDYGNALQKARELGYKEVCESSSLFNFSCDRDIDVDCNHEWEILDSGTDDDGYEICSICGMPKDMREEIEQDWQERYKTAK